MARKPLFYTFGNHMHWAGTEWSWGYDALASSVRDMLRLAEESGAKGNVNFDAVGYEKLAVEAPEVLAQLRAAVQAGRIEVVGGSYGQPCGLFHGGESNVRQRVLGVRAVLRLFGVRPRTFWEGEFDLFPQLPQLLASAGYTGASLFSQWKWSTPTVPEEQSALVSWEGLDGSALPTVPKNELCLHPWPEEFDGRLELKLVSELDEPALLQWVELMPSSEWMSRAELLLPRLKELFADARFEVRPVTLGELIAILKRKQLPVRRYTLDELWHGASLGKNGDYMPRYSRTAEEQLLAAESISALAGLLGRPYASWDVYPTWELEEAWRELCIAQHHDVHEREGLCGAIGERSFERSLGISSEVFARTLEHLAGRVDALEGSSIVYNPLGWTRDLAHENGVVRDVPAFGYKVVDPYEIDEPRLGRVEMELGDETLALVRGDFRVTIDRARGVVTQIESPAFPGGVLSPARPIGELEMVRGGARERFETVSFSSDSAEDGEYAEFVFLREGRAGSRVRVIYSLSTLHDALWIRFQGEELARPDGGMHAGLSTRIRPVFREFSLVHDHPYGVSPVSAEHDRVRKYPTGDWASSTQVFEDVKRPFTASTFVDLLDTRAPATGAKGGRGAKSAGVEGGGLLVVHDGSQAFFREADGVRALLNMYDPWDEEHWDNVFEGELWLMPHGALTHSERMRVSMECNLGSPRFPDHAVVLGGGDLPPSLGALAVEPSNVLATAFYRESRHATEHLRDHAGHFAQFAPEARDPYVVRLVEFDGRPADVVLRLPGAIAKAARTNLMGEVLEPLHARAVLAPFGPSELPWSGLRLSLRAHEIATVMLDLELGRAVPRNLDEHRHVWMSAQREARR